MSGLENTKNQVIFLPHYISDHTPMLIKLGFKLNGKPIPFKFYNY